MTDEAYLFKQISCERKRNARGDHNKVRGGGRIVRFPSDNLTRKEKKQLSGEVKTYQMNEPVAWKTFCKWPVEMQTEYLKRLDGLYRPTAAMYAELFGTTASAVAQHRQKIKCQAGRYWGGADRKGFAAFCDPKREETEQAEKPKGETASSENLTAASLYALLSALQGSGARLTIEVTI
jgi:hypothetical protein